MEHILELWIFIYGIARHFISIVLYELFEVTNFAATGFMFTHFAKVSFDTHKILLHKENLGVIFLIDDYNWQILNLAFFKPWAIFNDGLNMMKAVWTGVLVTFFARIFKAWFLIRTNTFLDYLISPQRESPIRFKHPLFVSHMTTINSCLHRWDTSVVAESAFPIGGTKLIKIVSPIEATKLK